MNEQTRRDIETAREINKDVVCIQLAARATSPYEDYVHTSDPCMIKELVKLGWTQ